MQLTKYILAAVIMLAFDIPWITYFGRGIYEEAVYAVQGSALRPRIAGAIGAYLLLTIGIVQFAVNGAASGRDALTRGALLGLIAYGVFDTTCYAIFNGWSARVALIDMIWGTLLSAVVSYLVYVYG